MSFSIIPQEIKQEIMNFVNPTLFNCQELRFCGRICTLVSEELKTISTEKMLCLKNIHDALRIEELVAKYKENSEDIGFVPQLFDALASSTNIYHSAVFDYQTIDDVKDIVRLFPKSIDYSLGKARCRDDVNPLWVACYNKQIPFSIIELLLKSGANPNSTIKVCAKETEVIKDCKDNLNNERYETILALFQKYGLESIDI